MCQKQLVITERTTCTKSPTLPPNVCQSLLAATVAPHVALPFDAG
jgi:hypothetical protein